MIFRLLALEMGKPVLINDQDCDTDLPCPVDEQYITEEGGVPESQQTSPLLATIHVVRSIGQLTRTLRSPTVSPATLETFERHFNTCLATFPSQFHPKTDQDLDPRSLAPVIYLQNARLLLHRHNISPFCPYAVRAAAMDYCVSTALDTAHLLSRCMQPGPGPGYPTGADWRTLFASCAGTLLCTHIWRCVLFLLFRQEFAAALTCVQASAAVGDSRAVNAACGRHLSFFLRCLLDCLRRSDSELERDEEMMAYVSGDMQGTSDGSWVWQGSETGSQLAVVPSLQPSSPSGPEGGSTQMPDADQEGWEWVEETVQCLLDEQRQRKYERRDMQIKQESSAMLEIKQESSVTLAPEPAASDTIDQRSSSAHSRMTIASMIGGQ